MTGAVVANSSIADTTTTLPTDLTTGSPLHWGRLYGCAPALALADAAQGSKGLLVVVTTDSNATWRLENELRFFLAGSQIPVHTFPDWEILPYDVFSPLGDIISQRLSTLYRLPEMQSGILLVPVTTLMQRLPPPDYIQSSGLLLDTGDHLNLDEMRQRLEAGGYRCVPQVLEHGEFSVRGALLDLFPMGNNQPYRIDLFDNEVESIRSFDPETQCSTGKVDNIRLLPGREFPLDETAIERFRLQFRRQFTINAQDSLVYRDVSQGITPAGIEFYLPLFFEQMHTLFDYLPADTVLIEMQGVPEAAQGFLAEIQERYEQRRHDIERPLLPPEMLYLSQQELDEATASHTTVQLQQAELRQSPQTTREIVNFPTLAPPPLLIQAHAKRPAGTLQDHVSAYPGRILFAAESAGRREILLDSLAGFGIRPQVTDNWQSFLSSDDKIGITVAPLERGLVLDDRQISIIAETQLFGERAQQRRRRQRKGRDAESLVRDLTELNPGSPVVHEEHGVGRYLGLERLDVGGHQAEFLALEYAGEDKLYVPVASLHLISRYTGAAPEKAPLHRLGGEQWQRIKRRAAEKLRDVAAELLDIYARREAQQGYGFQYDHDEYARFSATFPFEETPDQLTTIESVVADMQTPRPMDRVVCGDVGFGKTEVAMRAAFIATQSGRQVVILVPTTLLAQQHYQNFTDRFADWPVRIEVLSRFRSRKDQTAVLEAMATGKVDIVIGTHKLLQDSIRFKQLGLVIVDEEHRFGVRHKEQLKKLRSQVDLLTLTATPIPRTLNMSMTGLRDLSIIATPPVRRHPIKTFISEWNDNLISEAGLREIKRGGQVYFLHNEVKTIDSIAQQVSALIPEAQVNIAHGQMSEGELERVMLDFYHRRFNVLVCTTIIESGIDIPTANTIIINRADKLGLAQLHQLRGRVGRSHHRAYAYLMVPPRGAMTADAIKRIEAIESMEDLGAGFALAMHDLEIRGAGELLGEEQSGQIHEIGFSLYMDLLERTVSALKSGKQPELDTSLDSGPEVDLQVPALLPDDYLPDVHTRLVMYKRIAAATDTGLLRELKVEMIDRFGLLPEPARNLFDIMELKLKAAPMGIQKIEAGATNGRLLFGKAPNIDHESVIRLIQSHPDRYQFDGQDRLRFSRDMPETGARFDMLHELLDTLTPKKAA